MLTMVSKIIKRHLSGKMLSTGNGKGKVVHTSPATVAVTAPVTSWVRGHARKAATRKRPEPPLVPVVRGKKALEAMEPEQLQHFTRAAKAAAAAAQEALRVKTRSGGIASYYQHHSPNQMQPIHKHVDAPKWMDADMVANDDRPPSDRKKARRASPSKFATPELRRAGTPKVLLDPPTAQPGHLAGLPCPPFSNRPVAGSTLSSLIVVPCPP